MVVTSKLSFVSCITSLDHVFEIESEEEKPSKANPISAVTVIVHVRVTLVSDECVLSVP